MSQDLNCRPSDLLGIQGVYEAYCLDQAVWYAGTHIDADLNEAVDNAIHSGSKSKQHKGKADMARKRVMRKYFGADEAPTQFADPAAMAR